MKNAFLDFRSSWWGILSGNLKKYLFLCGLSSGNYQRAKSNKDFTLSVRENIQNNNMSQLVIHGYYDFEGR